MKVACSLTGLAPGHMRTCLEALVMQRLRMRGHDICQVIPLHGDKLQFTASTALRFLSPAQLVHCLADHGPEIFQFIYAQVNLDRHGARLVVDHEGTEWLVLDDCGVDLPPYDFHHDLTSIALPEPATALATVQGGAA